MSETEKIRRDAVSTNLELKAIIQDIQKCQYSIDDLNKLNKDGREKIGRLRNCISKLKDISHGELLKNIKLSLELETQSLEDELRSTVAVFQKANLTSVMNIEKSNREELLDGGDSYLRHRKAKEKEDLVKMSSDVTDRLLSISRTLADSTQSSADTLGTLGTSSSVVEGTRGELDSQGMVINQSGKLLAKYGRREQTDKFLILFAFAFFLACVIYIIQKRLF